MKSGQLKTTQHDRQSRRPSLRNKASTSFSTPNLQQSIIDPQKATQADVLQMQEQAGNTAVLGWMNSANTIQREPASDESGTLNGRISSAIQGARGSGVSIPQTVRREMEGSFNTDFSGVHLHTDPSADHLSRQINARAFTIGSDIFFRQGAFAPGTQRGNQTLRHELTHVVQQNGTASSGGLKLSAPNTAEEHQAAQVASSHSAPSSAPAASAGTVQREIDYAQIASKFGGSVTESMVEVWCKDVKPKNHEEVSRVLSTGNSLTEFDKGMLKVYKVDMQKMASDLHWGEGSSTSTGIGDSKPGKLPNSQNRPMVPPKPERAQFDLSQDLSGPKVPQASQGDIEKYILKKCADEHMPSGPMMDVLKDVGHGDVANLQTSDVDEVVKAFKERNFTALSAKGVSIEHIVSFSGSFERLGVGDTKDPDKGIPGKLKDALMGGEGKGGKGQSAADFMQKSALWDLLGATGSLAGSAGMLNSLHSDLLGTDTAGGIELGGGLLYNSTLAIQSTGSLMQSIMNMSNMKTAHGFNSSINKKAMGAQAGEASFNMLNALGGYASAGLGIGQSIESFSNRHDANDDGQSGLGLAKGAVDAGLGGLSMTAHSIKAGLADSRGRTIKNEKYQPSNYLSADGNKKEKETFPKLQAILADTQSKKSKGEAMDISKGAISMTGGTLKSVGNGVGGTAGSILKGVGAGINLVGALAKPIVNFIKGKYQDHKAQKAGFRNTLEYRSDRVRSLEGKDESGQKTTINLRVGNVADDVNSVYSDFAKYARLPPSKKSEEISKLSTSRLLISTADYATVNQVFTSTEASARREAIKNVLLSRTATF